MSVQPLSRVVLSFPSLVSFSAKPSGEIPTRSWIQLARTGSFVSNRYGKFAITKTDLRQMLHNFQHVTPQAPTELPIDVDHLSMDPKKPGDGVAAGWMKNLELRNDDEELWAEVEWTPAWAERIHNKEYRFISPSFVKDYTHKNGDKIGTTLLAAAITNHPFLEGMQALTLYNFSALGDLATAVDEPKNIPTKSTDPDTVVNLAEVGQRVMVKPDARTTDEVVGVSFEVAEVVGDGDDAFVSVKDANGLVHKWFRATELVPASPPPGSDSPLPNKTIKEERMPHTDVELRAGRFALNVKQRFEECRDWLKAFELEAAVNPDGAECYRRAGVSAIEPESTEPLPVLSLSVRVGETFDELATRYAVERNVPLREAIRTVGLARPELAAARD
jgi:hypothetical protein